MQAADKNNSAINFVETEFPVLLTENMWCQAWRHESAPLQRYTEDNGPNCFMPSVYVSTENIDQLVIDNPVRVALAKFEEARA